MSDPGLSNDFLRDGDAMVENVNEADWGFRRYSLGRYLRGRQPRTCLIERLDLA